MVIEFATLAITAGGFVAGIYGVRKAGQESEARQKYWSKKADDLYKNVKKDYPSKQ